MPTCSTVSSGITLRHQRQFQQHHFGASGVGYSPYLSLFQPQSGRELHFRPESQGLCVVRRGAEGAYAQQLHRYQERGVSHLGAAVRLGVRLSFPQRPFRGGRELLLYVLQGSAGRYGRTLGHGAGAVPQYSRQLPPGHRTLGFAEHRPLVFAGSQCDP